MKLSRKILLQLDAQKINVPADVLFTLPEKVLQFGTGVLLRGLPDHFIDKANKQNIFNGRIVVVKSTATGGTDAFAEQDGLYTLLEKGVEDGIQVEKIAINASVSRVLSANEAWEAILACAASIDMQVIISNTTEVGITLVEEDAYAEKPVSFPGRVLAFLLARYRVFNGSSESGMVIIPTELIVDNGNKLKDIVITLAKLKGETDECIHWLETANDFCNSLVDCIVPGKLPAAEQADIENNLGYTDQLMIMSEPYRLWAIETTWERTRSILSFSKCDDSVVLARDINKFRELKLRLLNGTHTLSCGLAYLAGFTTVKAAMQDRAFVTFTTNLMLQEIVPLVANGDISMEEANHFAMQVIDRFKNPYIEHLWLSITVQYTSKMVMRTVPLVEKYYAQNHEAPELMALGFAAFLLFMRSEKDSGEYYGENNHITYKIADDKAALLYNKWKSGEINNSLQDEAVFGRDLTQFPGFAEAVNRYLLMLLQDGAVNTLRSILAKKSVA
jgi:tagaturonate reductase